MKRQVAHAHESTVPRDTATKQRAIIEDAAKNDYRLSSFILGVVNSAAFRMAKPQAMPVLTDAGGR